MLTPMCFSSLWFYTALAAAWLCPTLPGFRDDFLHSCYETTQLEELRNEFIFLHKKKKRKLDKVVHCNEVTMAECRWPWAMSGNPHTLSAVTSNTISLLYCFCLLFHFFFNIRNRQKIPQIAIRIYHTPPHVSSLVFNLLYILHMHHMTSFFQWPWL